KKKDIGHNIEERVNNAIAKIIDEKLIAIIEDFIQKNADLVADMAKEIMDLVRYVPEILYQEAA
ncbi:hypothetical protein HMPREF9554_01357, partial [Treponema phagedenis F0421]